MAISKKLRFEILKRDKFTCQYCGKSAPEVILQVDHICPTSKNGNDQPYNLVTSCHDCNIGKSNRLLSEDNHILFRVSYLHEIYKIRADLATRFTFNEKQWTELVELVEMVFLTHKDAGGNITTYFDSLNIAQKCSSSINRFMIYLYDQYFEAIGVIDMKRLKIDNWEVWGSMIRFARQEALGEY